MLEPKIDERLDEIKKLKRRGTAFRNLDSFEEALKVFDKAIEELKQVLHSESLQEREQRLVRTELADTYGMKGGVYRRMREVPNHLSLALQQYRKGLKIERQDQQSTYNASNVITLSIMQEGKSPLNGELQQDLDRVIKQLEHETKGPRADEWWAWSDLGQFYLLRNDVENARGTYKRGLQTGPTTQELRRHLEVLRELRERTSQTDPALATSIEAVIKELEQSSVVSLNCCDGQIGNDGYNR